MLNLKYKAYNTKKLDRLDRMVNTSAWVWNHALVLQLRYYKLYNSYIHVGKMQKHFAKLRKKNRAWQTLNSQTVQELLQRQDMAYQRFFKKIAKRPPKFKKAKNFSSFVFKQSGYTLNGNVLTIRKVGRFKFSKSREYEKVKRITVKRDSLGDFYFVLTCDVEPKPYKRLRHGSIGMDFGVKTFLTLSDGSEIKNPEFFKQNMNKLRQKNRSFSSKVRGSSNRKRALEELNRTYKKVADRRSDFQWKLAHELCKNYHLIAIEDLSLTGMKALWGRKVSDLAFGEFVLKLEQVARKYGTSIVKIDRYFPSSKLCSCGYIHKGLTLADRKWTCPSCELVNKRDLNAANNILAEGIRLYRTRKKTSSEAS